MNLDNTENRSAFQVAADWKFDPAYIHAGSLEENDLVLKDILAQLWKTRRGTGAP